MNHNGAAYRNRQSGDSLQLIQECVIIKFEARLTVKQWKMETKELTTTELINIP